MKKTKTVFGYALAFVCAVGLICCLGGLLSVAAQDKEAGTKAEKSKTFPMTETEVKAWERINLEYQNAEQTFQQTLQNSIQSNFDAQTALETLGRIKIAYLAREYVAQKRATLEANLKLAHACIDCVIDVKELRQEKLPPNAVAKK